MTTSRYCVVGAGAAGLAAVQVLTRQGFAVDCFATGTIPFFINTGSAGTGTPTTSRCT